MEKLYIATESELLSLVHSTVRAAMREELAVLKPMAAIDSTLQNHPLTIKEAAEFIQRPVASIYNLVSKRLIPHSKIGNRLYFDKLELIDWIKSGRVNTNSELEARADEILTGKK